MTGVPLRLVVNPVAKVGASLILAVGLVLTLDWVSSAVALALELCLAPLVSVPLGRLVRRTAPIWIAAPLAAGAIALYGRESGASYFEFGLAHVTAGSLELALATGLRILAIALPAVVLFMTIDPTDLADGLAQVLHLPSRFVLGALAAFRLVSVLGDDWRSLERARRARGVADRARIRRYAGQAFALLVIAIRRASKLATAMEARGFGSDAPRTWARESRFGGREWSLLAGGLIVASAALTASIASGHWNFLGRG